METKELKIQAPKGYEIDKDNSTFECIRFKRIKKNITYDNVCNILFVNDTYFISDQGLILKKDKWDSKISLDKNVATNVKQLKKLLALNQLLNIAEYYNKLHSKQENFSLYYILFEKEYGYSVRPHYSEIDCLDSVVAIFNRKDDAQAVVDNPNFREILDTIYK